MAMSMRLLRPLQEVTQQNRPSRHSMQEPSAAAWWDEGLGVTRDGGGGGEDGGAAAVA